MPKNATLVLFSSFLKKKTVLVQPSQYKPCPRLTDGRHIFQPDKIFWKPRVGDWCSFGILMSITCWVPQVLKSSLQISFLNTLKSPPHHGPHDITWPCQPFHCGKRSPGIWASPRIAAMAAIAIVIAVVVLSVTMMIASIISWLGERCKRGRGIKKTPVKPFLWKDYSNTKNAKSSIYITAFLSQNPSADGFRDCGFWDNLFLAAVGT